MNRRRNGAGAERLRRRMMSMYARQCARLGRDMAFIRSNTNANNSNTDKETSNSDNTNNDHINNIANKLILNMYIYIYIYMYIKYTYIYIHIYAYVIYIYIYIYIYGAVNAVLRCLMQ